LENYDKNLQFHEEELLKFITNKKDINNIIELERDMVFKTNESVANVDKYFFKLVENAVITFTKEEYATAFDELVISKFLLEYIIFMRLFISNYQPLDLSSEAACKILEECMIEKSSLSSFIFDEKKTNSHCFNIDKSIFFSFIGAEMKTNIQSKAIYQDKSDKEREEVNISQFTKFYIEIVKMLNECDKRINQFNK